MKKLSLTIIMAVAVVGSAFAGTDTKTFKDKVVIEPTCKPFIPAPAAGSD